MKPCRGRRALKVSPDPLRIATRLFARLGLAASTGGCRQGCDEGMSCTGVEAEGGMEDDWVGFRRKAGKPKRVVRSTVPAGRGLWNRQSLLPAELDHASVTFTRPCTPAASATPPPLRVGQGRMRDGGGRPQALTLHGRPQRYRPVVMPGSDGGLFGERGCTRVHDRLCT